MKLYPQLLFIQTLVDFKPPRYDTDEIPFWAQVIGWLVFMFTVSPIPIGFFWRLWTAKKSNENVRTVSFSKFYF